MAKDLSKKRSGAGKTAKKHPRKAGKAAPRPVTADAAETPENEVEQRAADPVASQVHGVLKALLGQALRYFEDYAQASDARPAVTSGRARNPEIVAEGVPPKTVSRPSWDVADTSRGTRPQGKSEISSFESTQISQSHDPDASTGDRKDLETARSIVRALRDEDRMSPGSYTALFYLEELGRKGVFDGRVINMGDLPGGNKKTTRERISDLYLRKLVTKDENSIRFQKVTLTQLGKKAYEVLQFTDSVVGLASGTSALDAG